VLAERWGRRERDGVVITLALTHDRIAMLVDARRPTMTSALSRLEAEGLRRWGRDRRRLTESADAQALAARHGMVVAQHRDGGQPPSKATAPAACCRGGRPS
jgi:Crp-like helix-turn-helix domain